MMTDEKNKENKRDKKNKVGQISLSTAKVVFIILKEIGQITIDSFFHNSHAGRFGYSYGPRQYRNYHSTVSRLAKNGFLRKDGNIYKLTPKGEKEAFFSLLEFYKNSGVLKNNSEHEKWDGKWRIIFFDVPEKKRRYRDELRSMLKLIGFKLFQQSIWVYPYKVPSFLKDILFEEKIKQYTRLITTDSIEYDKDLRKMFRV